MCGDVPSTSSTQNYSKGKKLQRWQPRSHLGIFMGLSELHTSEAPQLLSVIAGSITTQLQVVLNDQFTMVNSIGREEEPPCQ
jgi:hypothetical protein